MSGDGHGEPFRLGYHPGLDGLRGAALVVVVAFHAKVPGFHLGHVGLIVFFVLSAFLITSLLFQEHDRRGSIDVANYLERRGRRILPALFVFGLAVGAYVQTTASPTTARDQWLAVAAMYAQVNNWLEAFVVHPMLLVQHTWSVAVEVQFYVAWLLIMLWLLRRDTDWRRVAAVILGLGAVVVVVRGLWWGLAHDTDQLLYPRILTGTDLRIDQIGIGCVLGIAYARGWLDRIPARTLAVAAVAAAAVPLYVVLVGVPLTVLFGGVSTLIALAAAVIIAACVRAPDRLVPSLLSGRVMVWLGGVSYAVYLYHVPIYRILREKAAAWPLWQHVVVGTAISFALGVASTYTVERWARTPRRTAPGGLEGPLEAPPDRVGG